MFSLNNPTSSQHRSPLHMRHLHMDSKTARSQACLQHTAVAIPNVLVIGKNSLSECSLPGTNRTALPPLEVDVSASYP